LIDVEAKLADGAYDGRADMRQTRSEGGLIPPRVLALHQIESVKEEK
jgi:hypothetical protein